MVRVGKLGNDNSPKRLKLFLNVDHLLISWVTNYACHGIFHRTLNFGPTLRSCYHWWKVIEYGWASSASSISNYEQDYSHIRYLTGTPFKRTLEAIEGHVILTCTWGRYQITKTCNWTPKWSRGNYDLFFWCDYRWNHKRQTRLFTSLFIVISWATDHKSSQSSTY